MVFHKMHILHFVFALEIMIWLPQEDVTDISNRFIHSKFPIPQDTMHGLKPYLSPLALQKN
ncbi:Hypothetical protein ORPV_248 [Orpheovirus IHUMI-LCC2]|uniref:Uncharacterized protein n=1 Tax=Orpheovirus IHUMI-LCC2 TaxID=2023057 RepID=A0A2I2L3N3_9VIRU|nr:Hypothetical protein ORPV_248 [Orpheovirus IHUMI-LCC2]SNW62152.1 Hypothetical protein ORPV_248 [Orpheovirus IHUMI-LCC2]